MKRDPTEVSVDQPEHIAQPHPNLIDGDDVGRAGRQMEITTEPEKGDPLSSCLPDKSGDMGKRRAGFWRDPSSQFSRLFQLPLFVEIHRGARAR